MVVINPIWFRLVRVKDSHYDLFDQDAPILYEDMKNFREQDFDRLHRVVKKMARRLSTRASRRYKATRSSNRIDLRRTARLSIQSGGAMAKVAHKARKKRRSNLLLLCDVSGSMSKYAAFVVSFIYGLRSSLKRIKTFVFSEDIEILPEIDMHEGDPSEVMADLINSSLQWGKTTDIGNSLESLFINYTHVINLTTVAIILSDTRTLHLSKAVDQLKRLRHSVKQVIWLNPIPSSRWRDVATVGAISSECRMFECYTLKHLDTIFRAQLFPN